MHFNAPQHIGCGKIKSVTITFQWGKSLWSASKAKGHLPERHMAREPSMIMWTQNDAHCTHPRQMKPDDWRMWLAWVSSVSGAKSCSNQIWISYGCQLNGTNEVQLRKKPHAAKQNKRMRSIFKCAQIEKTITLNGEHQSDCKWRSTRRMMETKNESGSKSNGIVKKIATI